MATKKPAPKSAAARPHTSRPIDSRGKVRVYADVSPLVAKAFKILALQRDTTSKELLESIMARECEGVETH